ncbi:MAG: type III-B CRISPR module-associated protein Cmr5 [Armatimonadota bacterium]|nr:type III-B CRISPR module-associated protein Cmr5 [Armatimonadota bacterium]
MKTRAQQDMELAAQLVQQVSQQDGETQRIYGGLCHSFPVMVRTCGLCQAIAFSRAKEGEGKEPREKAHRLLLQHVAEILDVRGDLLQVVRNASASDYMLYTRRILSAWVYFKRFAESILKVSSAAEGGQ